VLFKKHLKFVVYAILCLSLVVAICIILAFTSLSYLLSETMKSLGAEWALALVNGILTAVLVTITSLQMTEARRTRLEANRPSFSLQPAIYVLGGGFISLDLVNGGGTARNIEIDVSHLKANTLLYNSSIGKSERTSVLQGHFPSVGGLVKVHVKYADSYGHMHEEDLQLDFNSLGKANRSITYLKSPMDMICQRLDDIEKGLRAIERKLR